MAVLRFERVASRQVEDEEREGIVGLVRETVDGLRTLIGDHIKLARVELVADLKSYGRGVAVLAVAGVVLAVGYVFAWIAAAFGLARPGGAPLAFGAVAALHLVVGRDRHRLVDGEDAADEPHARDGDRGAEHRAACSGTAAAGAGVVSDRALLEGGSARTSSASRRAGASRVRRGAGPRAGRVVGAGAARRGGRGRTDWRRLVRRQPAAFVGGAVALGFWLGYRR